MNFTSPLNFTSSFPIPFDFDFNQIIPYIWSNISNVNWTMVSSIGAVAGVLVSAFTFYKSYSKMKNTEQIKIAHDISNQIAITSLRFKDELKRYGEYLKWKADDGDLTKPEPKFDIDDLKFTATQYLNQLEWLSFLINKKQIFDDDLIDYFKPSMLEDHYTILDLFPEFKDKFEEFNKLCEKWKKEDEKKR